MRGSKWREGKSIWTILPACLTVDADRQAPGYEHSQIEEKLDGNQTQVNWPGAMFRQPPDAEEKQDGKRRLKTVQNGQCRRAVDRENRKGGSEQTAPQPGTRSRQFGTSCERRIDQDNAHPARQRNEPAFE